jgi:hypothetical protein
MIDRSPQRRTTHNYALSVQDWCYNTATLNVTIVTENTVSMNQGNTEAHGGQKRVVHTKFKVLGTIKPKGINRIIAKIEYKVTYV